MTSRKKLTTAQQKLVLDSISLAYWFAQRFFRRNRRKFPIDDLKSVACEGLVQAALSYQPNKGSFSTWAGKLIKWNIMEYMKNSGTVHTWLKEEDGQYRKNPAEVIAVDPWLDNENNPVGFESRESTPEMNAERLFLCRKLQKLPKSQREVFVAVNVDETTYQEFATKTGVSRQAAHAMYNRAVKNMRQMYDL
jgi:RNA polymerase sigma factor (sigma-70 family)